MPEPKTVDEIARWDKQVRGDNSKDREKWRADDSWALEDDFVALLAFGEPMMGYHGNQCFDVLDRWPDIFRLPVLTMLDVCFSRYADVYQPVPEEHSALSKWLGGLRARARSCGALGHVHRTWKRGSMTGWVSWLAFLIRMGTCILSRCMTTSVVCMCCQCSHERETSSSMRQSMTTLSGLAGSHMCGRWEIWGQRGVGLAPTV
jgi:hypothetical protein